MSRPAPVGLDYPGKTLGIVGLVVAVFFTFVGSIISFVAWRQSRAAGYRNTPALIGFSLGLVLLGFWIIVGVIVMPFTLWNVHI